MSSIKHIALFTPTHSQYRVLHHFTEELHEALLRKGFSSRLLKLEQGLYEEIRSNPPHLTICFNGSPTLSGGLFIADLTQCPHMCWLVDHPYHYWYMVKSRYTIIACNDEIGCRMLRESGFEQTLFLPHAATALPEEELSKERDLPIVFLSSFHDFEAERQSWWQLPYRYGNLLEETAQHCLSDPYTNYIYEFLDGLQKISQGASKPLLPLPKIFELLTSLERYLKGKAKALALCSLPEGKVHVFNEKWQPYLLRIRPDIAVYPTVSYCEALALMRRAKIVFNSSIHSSNGGHERIFSAMAAGATSLTNWNPYMGSHFTDDEVAFYRHNELEKLSTIASTLLEDENRCAQIAAQGRAKLLRDHTWEARIDSFIPAIEKIQQQLSESPSLH